MLTHAVRILSDVFDKKAQEQNPDNNLGKAFRLGRLVLVAPDIPVESILSGRANFLKSSLRRFKESYVFCNEADLALRLASTAANYISFPARTRFRVYKQRKITDQHFKHKSDRDDPTYGVLNPDRSRLENGGLEIRTSRLEHLKLIELATHEKEEHLSPALRKKINKDELLSVARRFTYFDCTDYRDTRIDYCSGEIDTNFSGITSHALVKRALYFFYYFALVFCPSSPASHALSKQTLNFLDYFALVFCPKNSKNLSELEGHGGYFRGDFTQNLIYGLAFLGEANYCEAAECSDLNGFEDIFKEKQLQVILASNPSPQKQDRSV